MEQTLKGYLVKSIDCYEIDGVQALFDSREKAKAYLHRFKTYREEMEIMEIPLNPKYIVNKLADPYCVSFKGKEKNAFYCEIYDDIDDAAKAEKESYELTFFPGNMYNAMIEIMLFAASEEEAIAKGIKKRDEVIASGEWEKAYQESKR
jgi:hypothetical protein